MQQFIHQLLQLQIAEQGHKNLIFSPLSLELLLSLILPGTQGKIREALLTALEISETEVEDYLAELQSSLESFKTIKDTTLKLANSLWHNSRLKVQDEYKSTIDHRFPFELHPFKPSPEQTQQSVDDWVSKSTNGFIPSLPVGFSENDDLLLLSALYLKGFWQQKFSLYMGEKRPFYQLDGSATEEVVFMLEARNEAWMGQQQIYYFKQAHFHAVRIMLRDQRIGFEVYLPFEQEGLPQFLNELKADDFDQWKDEFQLIPYYYVLLPKFEIENHLDFEKHLKSLGLQSLFESSNDLAPMLGSKFPSQITALRQLAKIKVEEEGLEAAAVSYAKMNVTGTPPQTQRFPMVHFEADHPFLYRIVDTISNKTLFQGIFSQAAIPTRYQAAFDFKRNLDKYRTRLTQDLEAQKKVVVVLVLLEIILENDRIEFKARHLKSLNKIWRALSLPLSDYLIKRSNKKHYRRLTDPDTPWYGNDPKYHFDALFADILDQLRRKSFDDLDLNNVADFFKHSKLKVPEYDHLVALLKNKKGYKKISQGELKFMQPPESFEERYLF
ncbi:MAG TPA: hypothetical protein DCS93_04005 [Microscillaceae bacterium]|nr:hypothetical protein [Microscillaceae bacterium]